MKTYKTSKIIINHDLSVDIDSARVKLKPTDEWIDLKEIKKGNNIYSITDDETFLDIGLLQIKLTNGQYFNAAFKKNETDIITIHISPSEDIHEYLKNTKEILPDSSVGCELFTHCIETNEKISCLFTPVDAKRANYSYSATLGGWAVAGGGVTCEVYSTRNLTYVGWGGGYGLGKSWGTAVLDRPDYELDRPSPNNPTYGVQGPWSYVPVLFYFHFSAPHLTYNAGGFGSVGYAGGTGHYISHL